MKIITIRHSDNKDEQLKVHSNELKLIQISIVNILMKNL